MRELKVGGRRGIGCGRRHLYADHACIILSPNTPAYTHTHTRTHAHTHMRCQERVCHSVSIWHMYQSCDGWWLENQGSNRAVYFKYTAMHTRNTQHHTATHWNTHTTHGTSLQHTALHCTTASPLHRVLSRAVMVIGRGACEMNTCEP